MSNAFAIVRAAPFRTSATRRVGNGVAPWLVAVYLGSVAPGLAGELPNDIWNGNRGGIPSVTASETGVSVTLPEEAVKDAGGGSLATLVQSFLNRWAPEICSDLFDFQHAHQKLTLRAAVFAAGGGPAKYQDIVIDYRPSHEVNCIEPDNLMY